ncbi:hypothetical protein EKG37_05960 [Robertmurraya yapensis]|uniref:Uncharacterized protein n=1 Tax=Bacillus yapensis TaxID=2492960 RepID=A0A3S0J0L5_9BACI|nr:hypothetical protein [Bacillus yapensis]RTR35421.1 hypothetical protein EKG37_05960 [Bacillus yapensis]TKS97930.1 hypothetical protein FAR12_05960 [Bacillus yapensis]
MSTSVTAILAIFSIVMWIAVSREAVKPTQKINWRKMITLLSAGSLSTLALTIVLFQNLQF